jgi:SNF2 family DNA or RNA helicase
MSGTPVENRLSEFWSFMDFTNKGYLGNAKAFKENYAAPIQIDGDILSLKAGGTGLNLTVTSQVIHYDLWWNPAVENQTTDRAYRIGQRKNVMVHRLICKNTFEGRIDATIRQKKHLAEMTVASGENWIGKLSNSELREIFK